MRIGCVPRNLQVQPGLKLLKINIEVDVHPVAPVHVDSFY